MSTREIARLLEDAAAHVPPPHLADTAWTRVVRVRRRRRVAGSVAIAVVAVALAVAVGGPLRDGRRAGPAPFPPDPAATRPDGSDVDRLPERLDERRLDWLSATTDDLARAALLRPKKITQADALFQVYAGDKAPESVYAAQDGAFHRLDLKLDWVTDDSKTKASPLRPGSLSPDGLLAAFPQRDEVVVVDLVAASARQIPVAGNNLDVVWATTGSVLVGQDGATFLVDVATGRSDRVPGALPVTGLSGTARDAGGLIELASTGTRLVLREWSAVGARPTREQPIDQWGVRPYAMTAWSGPGWRAGSLVVRGGTARTDGSAAIPAVAVVDVQSGAVRRLLALDGRRANCCVPLGWIDQYTVVLRVDPLGLIGWNIRDGTFASIAPPFPGTVALRPS